MFSWLLAQSPTPTPLIPGINLAGILAFMQSPIGLLLCTLVVGWLSKSNPALGSLLHRVLELLGLKFDDPKKPATTVDGIVQRVRDVLAGEESPADTVKYDLADRALALWRAGKQDEASRLLDAACLILDQQQAVSK